jgi:hypothetical protein
MKKIIIFSFLLINNCIYSQISYPNAKQYLKGFLVMQALLAENRTEDLGTFFVRNNYSSTGVGEQKFFFKTDININNLETYIVPIIFIRSGGTKIYADNFLEIFFLKKDSKGVTSNLSINEIDYIKNTIQNLYETGMTYPMLKLFTDPKNDKKLSDIEKIDRYTFKLRTDDGVKYLKASNFTKLSAITKDETRNVLFFGPGKTKATELMYFEPIPTDDVGKYRYKMQIASYTSEFSQSIDKFNIDFFISLNDFNDRIWLDK